MFASAWLMRSQVLSALKNRARNLETEHHFLDVNCLAGLAGISFLWLQAVAKEWSVTSQELEYFWKQGHDSAQFLLGF